MRRELADAVYRNPARAAVMAIGSGVIAASNWLNNSTVGLLGGLFLVALGGLLPWLEELALGKDGFRARTRAPEVAADSTRMVEETTTELDEGKLPELDEREVTQFPSIYAADAALRTLLSGGLLEAALPNASLHLYLFDAEENALLPAFEDKPNPLNRWPIGAGAVGICYESAQSIIVEGADIVAGAFGLTAQQAEHYQTRTAIVAVPVLNRADELLAVISASTQEPDPLPTLESREEALDLLAVVAASTSRVLVDLLHWYSDTPSKENR